MVRISSSRLDMEEGRIDRAIFKDYGETLVGGVDSVTTETALTFDGTDDLGTVTANSSLNTDDISISVWIKPSVIRVQGVITKNVASSWRFFMRSTVPGEFEFDALGDTYNLRSGSTNLLKVNEWNHIAVTYDKAITTAVLYLNGEAINSNTTFTTAGNDFSSNVSFGPQETNRFSGDMDEARIYSRALTPAEIFQLYNKEHVTGSLVGHWKFYEGTGTSVADISGNSNTMSLTGSPVWSRYVDIQLGKGNAHHVTLTADTTFAFSNPTPIGSAQTFTLFLKQDAVGGRTVTWPSSVQWIGGVTPTITSEKNRYDIFTFTTLNAGSTWLGAIASQNFQEKKTLWSFGAGGNGRLGHNSTTSLSSPTQVGALTTWTSVTGGRHHSLALKTDGTLWAWGRSSNYGQLGHNNLTDISSPAQVGTQTTWAMISAGRYQSIALKTDGTIWTWGQSSNFGQLGHNSLINRSSPTQVGALTTWAAVSGGRYHNLALKNDGTLWSWGRNTTGQLGNNSVVDRSSPTQVGSLTDWAIINGGGVHTRALKTDGTLWTWGNNGNGGQLGHNSTISRSSPTQVGSLTDWAAVGGGRYHNLAIKTDGTLWSWGENNYGQLGRNTTSDISSPAQVGSETTWAAVGGGGDTSMALKTDGTLWAWGRGTDGQLGYGATNRSSPIQVGAGTNWAAVGSGNYHSFVVRFP